ncbi:MAG TPA: transcriptional repressor [Stellaceae bacterium]|nr:transcriptional repressor [Stellaceae bacterium]
MTAIQAARLPKNYQLVLAVVRSLGRGTHATTREIFAEAKRKQPRLGYSTVYRALLRLRDLGEVAEVNIPGLPSAVYESATSKHAHFHCQKCGRVEDISFVGEVGDLAKIVQTNHSINDLSLILHGICADCAAT